jgi:hypothetical protein
VLTNAGAADPSQERVVVVAAADGQPIEGALVVRDGQQASTNAQGVANFPPSEGTFTVSVFDQAHNYVTLVDVDSSDILIPLSPLSGAARTGGFQGNMNFQNVNTDGDINVGLAGASLDGELANFNLETLLGDSFNTSLAIPGLGETELPLPGGLVLDGVVFGFPITLKDTYFASSPGGFKVAWGIGGKIDGNEIIGLVMGGDSGGILQGLLPFFENFDHTIQPLEVTAIARVADTSDIDGDGDTSELIPDYDNFPSLPLAPSVEQRLRTGLTLPAFPVFNNSDDTFVITVGGIIAEGIGFIPMGLNASSDDNNDGRPDPIILRQAPAHSGLSVGEYAIIALTFDPEDLDADFTSGIDLPKDYTTIVWQGDNIPSDLEMTQNFLPLPEAQWDVPARQFSHEGVDGADLFRVVFRGAEGSWEVWFNAEEDDFIVPAAPDGFEDWSASSEVQIDAFDTRDGLTLDTLVESNETSVGRISSLSEGFSRAVIGE